MKAKTAWFLILLMISAQIFGCTKTYKEQAEEKAQKTEETASTPSENKNYHELDFVRKMRIILGQKGGSFIPVSQTKLLVDGETVSDIAPYSAIFSCFHPSRRMEEYMQFGVSIVTRNTCFTEDHKATWNQFVGKEAAKRETHYCWFEEKKEVFGPATKYALLVADGCQKPLPAQLGQAVQHTYWRGCNRRVCPLEKFDRSIDVCKASGGVYLPLSAQAESTVRYTKEKAEDGNGEGTWYFFSVSKIVPAVYCISKIDVIPALYLNEQLEKSRLDRLASHSEWPDELKKNLAQGLIFKGMPLEMLKAAFGDPKSVKNTMSEDGEEQMEVQYLIFGQVTGSSELIFLFKKDKLLSWQERN